jgi:hypothetical protein
MPDGLVRSGDARNGTPVTLPLTFGNEVNWNVPDPAEFGNPIPSDGKNVNTVNWLPSPSHFGNVITP